MPRSTPGGRTAMAGDTFRLLGYSLGVGSIDERRVVIEWLVDLALCLQEVGACSKCLGCAAVLAAAEPGIGSLFLGVGKEQQVQGRQNVFGFAAYHLDDAFDLRRVGGQLAAVGVI